jgi:hypothetical protein
MPERSIWIGYDPREAEAFSVCRESIRRYQTIPLPTSGINLSSLRKCNLYTRPTEQRDGRLWDVISEAPMSTEFAISRFLTPRLAGSGWALFMDCDMLARCNLSRVFDGLNRDKAVYCVQHKYNPPEGVKMDGQVQTQYARKNWSSFMIFNCEHPSNQKLTVEMINTVPGRDLHRFCWLADHEIGSLNPGWNFLVGHTDPKIEPRVVHFTEGLPNMPGYENVPYADEWREVRDRWAA